MGRRIKIRLEVYLPFRGARTWRGEETLYAGTTAAGLLEQLALPEPELAVLVNGRSVPETTKLQEGDEVAVLRHAEGGA